MLRDVSWVYAEAIVRNDQSVSQSINQSVSQSVSQSVKQASKQANSKMWNGITNPFPHFNGYTVDIWEIISDITSNLIMDVIIYAY